MCIADGQWGPKLAKAIKLVNIYNVQKCLLHRFVLYQKHITKPKGSVSANDKIFPHLSASAEVLRKTVFWICHHTYSNESRVF